MNLDSYFLNIALLEAKKAFLKHEAPIGAVVVLGDRIIARAHNLKESKHCPTAHAELLAIQKAARKLHDWRLLDCTLYTTLEPCPMCAGALFQARLSRVVFGARDLRWGAAGSIVDLFKRKLFNHIVICEYLEDPQSAALLKQFFKERRANQIDEPIS